MKKTLKRMTCSALAMLLVLTCICIPASAATNNLNLFYDGENANFYFRILDENGNPVNSMRSLPFQGTGSVTLEPGYAMEVVDSGGAYFNVPSNSWISFSITFSTSAGLAFGYKLPSGAQHWKYDGSPSTQHEGYFRVTDGGDMWFLIKNTSASPRTLTSVYIG